MDILLTQKVYLESILEDAIEDEFGHTRQNYGTFGIEALKKLLETVKQYKCQY